MNERLQARVDKIEAEIARREEAALSTSERQARYVTGRGRSADVVVVVQRERVRTWGEDDERPERDGDVTSRRQAARITRGRS